MFQKGIFAIGLAVASSFPASSAMATSIQEQFDARVIELLRLNGADLRKPHEIDFFFVFGKEAQANAAAKELRALGHEIRAIKADPEGSEWLLHSSQKLAPSLETMNAATRKLSALAKTYGGEYDGWGTKGENK